MIKVRVVSKEVTRDIDLLRAVIDAQTRWRRYLGLVVCFPES